MSVLYGFIEGALVIFYTLLISTKLHIIHMLIHIGNEMEPFRRDDDEAFLADIIGTARTTTKRMLPRTMAANTLMILAMAMITRQNKRLCKMIAQRYIQFVLIYI